MNAERIAARLARRELRLSKMTEADMLEVFGRSSWFAKLQAYVAFTRTARLFTRQIRRLAR